MSKEAMKRIANKDMRQIEKMNLSDLGIIDPISNYTIPDIRLPNTKLYQYIIYS